MSWLLWMGAWLLRRLGSEVCVYCTVFGFLGGLGIPKGIAWCWESQ